MRSIALTIVCLLATSVAFSSMASAVPTTLAPPNGGYGSGFDATVNLGQNYPSGVPNGTITKVCFYLEASSGSVEYGIAVAPGRVVNETQHVFTGSVSAGSSTGWACQSVSKSWNSTSLFVHRTGGTGKVGYKQNVVNGQAYDGRSGWWQHQYTDNRAYRVDMLAAQSPTTPGTTTLAPPDGGHGTGFDATVDLGQNYPFGVPTGTITAVCFYLEANSGFVTYGIAAAPSVRVDETEHLFTGIVVAGLTTGWACETVAQAWNSTSLFVHRTGGMGKVGYKQNVVGGQAYDGRFGSWIHQPTDDRAYRVDIVTF